MTDDPAVTLPASDLHALIIAAELGARVQDEVLGVTQDVMFKRKQPTFREVVTRCNRVYSEAVRVRDNPYEGRDPAGYEIVQMREIADARQGFLRVPDIRKFESLVLKRLAVCGTGNYYVAWGDKSKTTTTDVMQYVRLTDRGHQWLAKNRADLLPAANPLSLPKSD